MSYLKDREIWLSSVPTGNPPAGYVWVFIQNGVFVVRDSNGVDKIMATTTGTVTNATSASYVEYSNVANKPALISGSSQVSYTGLSNTPAGIVSGSTQVSFNGITDKPALVSSSAQIVGYNVFATTGSNQFNGSQAVTGSLTVTGQVVAQTLNVQQVTSSIVYSSGSNVFGNSLSNTQQFTGSLQVTGSTHYLLGSVGVGIAVPTNPLHIASNTLSQLNIQALSGNTNAQINLEPAGTGIALIGPANNVDLAFRTNATTRMLISGSGNVGIGTASPSASLDIVAPAGILNPTVLRTYSNQHGLGFKSVISGTYTTIETNNTSYPLVFNPSGGNVGIGTASPGANLDIQRVAGDSNDILRLGSNQNYYFGFSRNTSNGALQIQGNQTGNNNISLAPTSGNVGIGTAGPGNKLVVVKADNSTDAIASFAANNLTQEVQIWYAGVKAGGTSTDVSLYLSSKNAGNVVIETGGGEKMRVSSAGNVGIGTATINASSGYKMLKINGATTGGEIVLAGAEVEYGYIYASSGIFVIDAIASQSLRFRTGAQNRMDITSGGDVLLGATSFPAGERMMIQKTEAAPLGIDRRGSDGGLLRFYHDGTEEGNVTVSGTTVSYNGGHLSRYSQTVTNSRIEGLVKGTVMSNLNQMAVWINPETGEPYPNEQLNCTKISDVEDDPNVAGVFVNWDNDDQTSTNDMNIAMTGDMIIRIAQDIIVQRGDLLTSAGDGTAKPQGDNIIRNNTIAKVTSTHVTCTYEDGSYCVPCVLMAC